MHFNHKMIVPMFEDAMDTGGKKARTHRRKPQIAVPPIVAIDLHLSSVITFCPKRAERGENVCLTRCDQTVLRAKRGELCYPEVCILSRVVNSQNL